MQRVLRCSRPSLPLRLPTTPFFASLPSLHDIDACLAELAYVFDILGAAGVTLFTCHGTGHDYLGGTHSIPSGQN